MTAPLIIGGGPAGTAAAITLARAGHCPVLLEKAAGPSDKVCGDFLSSDSIQTARSLGVDPESLGAAPINRVRLIHADQMAESPLPFPAVGLSRRTFDAALLHQAEAAGAIVKTGQTVRGLTRDGNIWTADIAGHPAITAASVFLATGKHDLRDLPRPRTDRGAIGMKMYLALAPGPARLLEGATELTLFPGGYAGMQFIEAERAVLCIAVRRSAFQTHGGSWTSLINAVGNRCARFATMLIGAQSLLPRPLAVAGIPYGYQAEPGDLFRLGDQAAVIPSLTGDGMAIALHSGQRAAQAWLAGHDPVTYQRGLAGTLGAQMRLAGLLHCAGMHGSTQTAAVPLIRLFPGLLRYAARRTRLRTG